MNGIYKIYGDGFVAWCKDGTYFYHKNDGPAVEYADGTKYWYQDGLRHRLDGPAVERVDGTKSYYLNGRYYPDISTDEKWIIFQIIN